MSEANPHHGQALKRATLAALIKAADALPGLGPVLAGAGTFYREMAEATRDLPADARRALKEIAADYKAFLQREAPRHAPETLEVALVECFAILAEHGLPANELVSRGGYLDA